MTQNEPKGGGNSKQGSRVHKTKNPSCVQWVLLPPHSLNPYKLCEATDMVWHLKDCLRIDHLQFLNPDLLSSATNRFDLVFCTGHSRFLCVPSQRTQPTCNLAELTLDSPSEVLPLLPSSYGRLQGVSCVGQISSHIQGVVGGRGAGTCIYVSIKRMKHASAQRTKVYFILHEHELNRQNQRHFPP